MVGGLEESKWFLAHTLTLKEPSLAVCLEPLYGDCPSPRRIRPKEDDPHFLKAKCSVLISTDEVPMTQVNLLDLGRFIVSCHS